MHVTANRQSLVQALGLAERAAAARESVPVLSGVRLTAQEGWLDLTATDLEVTAAVRVAASVKDPGDRVVDARLFAGLVRRLAGESVELALGADGSSLEVVSATARFSLMSSGPEDFPELPRVSEGWELSMDSRRLREAFAQTVFAAATSDQRPVLSGVLVELEGPYLRVVATDGSRLAFREVKLTEPPAPLGEPRLFTPRAIVPARAVAEMMRLCDAGEDESAVSLRVGQRLACLQAPAAGAQLITRLIEGNFPPYRQAFLDELPTRLTFDRGGMLEAVQRAAVLSRRGPAVVILDMEPDGVVVRAREADVGHGEDRVAAQLEGPPVSVAYQAHFLEDVLKVFDEPEMVLEVGDPAKQGTFRVPGMGDYRYIVMPVRLG